MSAAQRWVICEESGRWAAALRVMFARSGAQCTPRLYETRTLGELSQHSSANSPDLILIEVAHGDLADVLQLLGRRHAQQSARFVGLLNEPNDNPGRQAIADLLWELGAAEVVSSPRQLGGLLALHRRLTTACGPNTADLAEMGSFDEWAWAQLPWQAT